MREIKFRGLTKYNRWVFGTPVYYESGESSIFGKFPRYGVEATNIYIRDEVIPETISQYTGLKDKNGRDIYEGDILDVEMDGYVGVVEWVFSQWQVVLKCVDKSRRGISDGINHGINDNGYDEGSEVQDYHIIGNIHENSELL